MKGYTTHGKKNFQDKTRSENQKLKGKPILCTDKELKFKKKKVQTDKDHISIVENIRKENPRANKDGKNTQSNKIKYL